MLNILHKLVQIFRSVGNRGDTPPPISTGPPHQKIIKSVFLFILCACRVWGRNIYLTKIVVLRQTKSFYLMEQLLFYWLGLVVKLNPKLCILDDEIVIIEKIILKCISHRLLSQWHFCICAHCNIAIYSTSICVLVLFMNYWLLSIKRINSLPLYGHDHCDFLLEDFATTDWPDSNHIQVQNWNIC